MKTLLVIALIGSVLASAGLAADPQRSARDITQGNVRVVLMSVGQTTVFPNAVDKARPSPHGGTNGPKSIQGIADKRAK